MPRVYNPNTGWWEEYDSTTWTSTGSFPYWTGSITNSTTSTAYQTWTTASEVGDTIVWRHYEDEVAERQRQVKTVRRHNDEAKARAHILLLENLTPAQRETLEKKKWFIIEGGKSKTKYRIRSVEHLVANIDVLDNKGKVLHRLCAHCRLNTIPLGDQLLAQKVWLENDEEAFLKVANRHAA